MPIAWAMGFSFITPNSRARDKETGNTDPPVPAECILPGPTVFQKHDSDLQTGGGKTLSLPSCDGPIVQGERQVQHSVESQTMRTNVHKCYSVLWQSSRWLQEARLPNETSWSQASHADDGESEQEAHREKRCGGAGRDTIRRCFCKIHLVAADGTGWEWGTKCQQLAQRQLDEDREVHMERLIHRASERPGVGWKTLECEVGLMFFGLGSVICHGENPEIGGKVLRISLKKKKKKKDDFWEQFQVHRKLRKQYRDFPPHLLVPPIINVLRYSGVYYIW